MYVKKLCMVKNFNIALTMLGVDNMQDKVFINEVRKRVSLLENKYATIVKDLDSARGFLAMLERESLRSTDPAMPRTHAEIVGDAVADMLSRNEYLHRSEILQFLLDKGIYVGRTNDARKQLAGISSLLSRDQRFKPYKSPDGQSGYWELASSNDATNAKHNDESDDSTPLFSDFRAESSTLEGHNQYHESLAS